MDTSKKVRVQLLKGEPEEYEMYKLNVKQRNALFGKFLDLNKYMGDKESSKDNILNHIKEGENILDFMVETLEKSMPAIDLNKVEGGVADKIFEENIEFILGLGDSKN